MIGGGVTGCSCALTLADRGVEVRLYEAREVAAGASGRNGGFALRGGAMAYDRARATLGAERASLLWGLTERSLARLAGLAGDAFRPVGSLRLAADPEEREALARELEALRDDGFAAVWLDGLPPPLDRLFHGAVLTPGDGAIQPADWVRRLAGHALSAGAEIVERTRADPDELDARPIVIAVDGLTAESLPELAPFVAPIRGQMLATEPIRSCSTSARITHVTGTTTGSRPRTAAVVGGKRDASFDTEQTAVEETTPLVQERLESLVAELIGHAPGITHRWAGIWGGTPTGCRSPAGSRGGMASGSRAATRATATSSVSPAATSWRARSWANSRRSSSCSTLLGSPDSPPAERAMHTRQSNAG